MKAFFTILFLALAPVQSAALADQFGLAIPIEKTLVVAIVSDDGQRAKILEEPDLDESGTTNHAHGFSSEDRSQLFYMKRNLRDQSLQRFDGRLREVEDKVSGFFLMPGTNTLVYGRFRWGFPIFSLKALSAAFSSDWYALDLERNRTKEIAEDVEGVVVLAPYPEGKLFGSRMVNPKSGKQTLFVFDPKNGALTDLSGDNVGSSSEIAVAPNQKLAVRSSYSCNVSLITGSSTEIVSISPEDSNCTDFQWTPAGDLLFSASPPRGSSYGPSYSIRSWNPQTRKTSTILQGNSHLFYNLVGLFRDGRLAVRGHGVDRTPRYSIEIFDPAEKRTAILFGSDQEPAFLGELDDSVAKLRPIPEDSLLAKARWREDSVLKDDDAMRRATGEILDSRRPPYKPASYESLIIAAKSRDRGIRVEALSTVHGREFSNETKIAAYRLFLHDSDPLVRTQAAGYLGELGPVAAPAIDELLELVSTTRRPGDERIIFAIAQIEVSERTEKILPIIENLLNDPHDAVTLENLVWDAVILFGPRAAPLSRMIRRQVRKYSAPGTCHFTLHDGVLPRLKAASAVQTKELREALDSYSEDLIPVFASCRRSKEKRSGDQLRYVTALGPAASAAAPVLADELSKKEYPGSFEKLLICQALHSVLPSLPDPGIVKTYHHECGEFDRAALTRSPKLF